MLIQVCVCDSQNIKYRPSHIYTHIINQDFSIENAIEVANVFVILLIDIQIVLHINKDGTNLSSEG